MKKNINEQKWGDEWNDNSNNNSWDNDSWGNESKKKETNTNELPKWASCLKSSGAKKQTENTVLIKNKKGNKLYFSKSGKFQYTFTSNPGTPNQMGKWRCNGTNGYLVDMDNGDKWDGSKWIENKNSSDKEKIQKKMGEITKGWVKDPTGNTTWEYQVRNCNWIAKKIGDKTEYNISKNAKFASSVKKLNKAYPSLISNCVGKQGNEKSAEYAKKFGQELERAKSLMDKKIEYTPSDYRKFLTNPATNTADSTATSAKPTVDIKPVESEISGPVRTINPADPF